MKVKITWNGMYIRENHYWIEGDMDISKHGTEYKMFITDGIIHRDNS